MAKKLFEFERYLKDALDLRVAATPWPQSAKLPFFLREQYAFFETRIMETLCLVMLDQGKKEPAPATIRKHMDQLHKHRDGDIIYVRNQVTAYNRKRLIGHKVPFVVPGNQMYLPMLGIDLREHFRSLLSETLTLKPSTQALIIHMLLRRNPNDRLTPTEAAQELGYTPMTMTRAFDELEAAKLADIYQEGRQRCLRISESKKELWKKAQPLMRSPVKKRVLVMMPTNDLPGPRAGLHGLAHYSSLAKPDHPVCALAKDNWKVLQKFPDIEEVPHQEPGTAEIEIWGYPPELFAENRVVDPFSLFLSLKDNPDERIEAALDEMMRSVQW
jgi:DNA-binding MarR family transcriptional regulator